MEYKIAIPSYNRPDTIRKKTLKYLLLCGVNMSNVYVFVATPEEALRYGYLKQELGLNIVLGVPTLWRQRNFITNYFKEGEYIVCMDDDVDNMYIKVDDKKFTIATDFNYMVERGFTECIKANTKLWGTGAVLNALFMKDKVSLDLRYIVGTCFGQIIDHSQDLQVTLPAKEDYEISIIYYIKFGCVVRLNNYAPKTKYYTEKGGMQGVRTKEHIDQSSYNLVQRYPSYCCINDKKTEHTEIRLFRTPKLQEKTNQIAMF